MLKVRKTAYGGEPCDVIELASQQRSGSAYRSTDQSILTTGP